MHCHQTNFSRSWFAGWSFIKKYFDPAAGDSSMYLQKVDKLIFIINILKANSWYERDQIMTINEVLHVQPRPR